MNEVLSELEQVDRPRGPDRDRDCGRCQEVGAAAAGREDGRQRGRRDRRGRCQAGASRAPSSRSPTRSCAAAAAAGALRDRRSRCMGRRPPLRRRDRRLGPGVRARSVRRDCERRRAGGRGDVDRGAEKGKKVLFDEGVTRPGRSARPSSTTRRAAPPSDHLWAETSELQGPVFVDVVAPAPRLIMFGAVPIAAALCTLSRAAGWRPFVVDPRPRFATRERFPDAEEIIATWPEEAFAQLGGSTPRPRSWSSPTTRSSMTRR